MSCNNATKLLPATGTNTTVPKLLIRKTLIEIEILLPNGTTGKPVVGTVTVMVVVVSKVCAAATHQHTQP